MRAQEVLQIVDDLDPNQIGLMHKLTWLARIEEQIYREIVCTHEGAEDVPWSGSEMREDRELIVTDGYCDVYRFYLEAQIALSNAELDRYNAAVEAFNAAYSTYQDWYNRTHMPLYRARKLRFL